MRRVHREHGVTTKFTHDVQANGTSTDISSSPCAHQLGFDPEPSKSILRLFNPR